MMLLTISGRVYPESTGARRSLGRSSSRSRAGSSSITVCHQVRRPSQNASGCRAKATWEEIFCTSSALSYCAFTGLHDFSQMFWDLLCFHWTSSTAVSEVSGVYMCAIIGARDWLLAPPVGPRQSEVTLPSLRRGLGRLCRQKTILKIERGNSVGQQGARIRLLGFLYYYIIFRRTLLMCMCDTADALEHSRSSSDCKLRMT